MQIRILTAADIRAAITMREAIDAMREAFAQLSAGRAVVPLRLPLETGKGVILFMPAFLPSVSALGAKVVSVYPGNVRCGLPMIQALVLVLDPETGVPTALLDGTYLTALRTGAASGLATELLAPREATVVALFGAGVQARTQLEAARTVRAIREVRIVSRTPESATRLAEEIRDIQAVATTDRRAVLRGAHIIITATTSSQPVFDGRDVEGGAHVNAIGSFRPDMQEIDATLVQRARVVVDSRRAALQEAGDLRVAIEKGWVGADDVCVELGEIVNGQKPGRTSGQEITLFKSVGNAVQDVAVAGRVLDVARQKGLGRPIEI